MVSSPYSPSPVPTQRPRPVRRRWGWAATLAVVPALVWSGTLTPPAIAQTASLAGEIVTGYSPQQAPQVREFVSAQAARLREATPEALSGARVALISPFGGGQQFRPSSNFLNAYAETLAAELTPLLGSDDPRVRLNVALVTERVARESRSTALTGLVERLLGDPSPAVTLWGIKAAGHLLPGVLGVELLAREDRLVPSVLTAARRHAGQGAVAQEAYRAVAVGLDDARTRNANLVRAALPTVVNATHELMTFRLGLYGPQAVPPDPAVDAQPTLLFSDLWNEMAEPQRTRSADLLVRLLDSAVGAAGRPDTMPTTDLLPILRTVGSGFTAIATRANPPLPEIERAGQALRTAGPATSMDQNLQNARTLIAAVRQAFPTTNANVAASPTASPGARRPNAPTNTPTNAPTNAR